MIIPPVPHSAIGVITKGGQVELSQEWRNFFDNLGRTLLTNAGTTALVPPSLSSDPTNDQFSRLTTATKQPLNGSMAYDSHTNEMKVWINGSYKVFTVV